MLYSIQDVAPFVAIYFIVYHLAINLIVLSLFVAVILDNLELEEDVKMIKQLKTREASAETQQKLPWRLRVFERFPDHPQMIELSRLPHEFIIPKIRDSFMRQFLNQDDIYTIPLEHSMNVYSKRNAVRTLHLAEHRPTGESMKRTAVSNIIRNVNNQRLLSGDASQIHLASMGDNKLSIYVQQSKMRLHRKSSMRRSGYRPKTVHTIRENGDITALQGRIQDDYDIKVFQYRKQQAELKRNQQEEDLRENHPYFDTPLFSIPRESNFRKFCQLAVDARYNVNTKDRLGQDSKISRYKQGHKFLGLVTYLDWIMIIVTILSAVSMSFETPGFRVIDQPLLQIAEYVFVICMSVELTLKMFAHGLLFTPKALIRDFSGVIDVSFFFISLIFLCWLPRHVPANSAAQFLMLIRATRPLRIIILVPDMRKVVYEVCRGFKEILLVSILLVVLMFIFAIYGVQIIGGQLARCNDRTYYKQQELCRGTFWRELYVSKMNVSGADPVVLVPRVWANPHNFNFDYIGSAMLALFEVLSLEGWLEIRDIIMDRMGPEHAIFVHIFVFIGTLVGLTLFVGVVIANYSENKDMVKANIMREFMECGGLTLSSFSSYREQQSMIMKFSSISVPKSASNGNNTEPSERPNIHLPIIIRQAPSPPPLPFIQLFFNIKARKALFFSETSYTITNNKYIMCRQYFNRRSMDIEAAANKKQELINGFQNLINEKDKRIEALINEKKENEKKYQENITKLTNEISQIKEDFKNEKKHQEDITKLTNEISPLKEDFKNEKKYQEDIAKLTNENQELQKKLVVIPQSNTPGINNYLRIMESMGFFNSN
ncbi:unnamed protein product [Rotaria sp. Silwood1]|nr:unnamed protein product [Rotaria sp. Silwood1]